MRIKSLELLFFWHERTFRTPVCQKVDVTQKSILKYFQRAEIRQSTIYYSGLLGQWDKRIVDQASDVPSIIFIHDFLQNSLQKSFLFIFLFF